MKISEKEQFIGVIQTEIKVTVNLTELDDNEHFFKFRFSEDVYYMIRRMLDTGAPVNFAIQKKRQKLE